MVGRRGRGSNSESGLRSLSLARKLAYFDGKFERLRRERQPPRSHWERFWVLEPLLRCGACITPSPGARFALAAGVLLILLLILLGCFLLCNGPASRFLNFCGRALLIQLLPYWDWTLYSSTDCLIRNPYYLARGLKSLRLTDCTKVCQKYPRVESLRKVDPEVVLQKYLRQNLPLVITDGAEEWVALTEFTVPFLTRDEESMQGAYVLSLIFQLAPKANGFLRNCRCKISVRNPVQQLFNGHPVLQNTIVCSYWDSHNSLEKSPSAFLENVHHQKLAQWAIQWKNCNKAAAKVIRGFYQRPYFLPPVVELADSNWLLMASQAENGDTGDIFVKVGNHDEDLLMWIAQLQGVFEVQLLPKDVCGSNCTHYTLQLSPGETVAVPLQMWEVQYRPFGSTAVGLAATGNWLQDSR